MRLLLVEDHIMFREVMLKACVEAGHTVAAHTALGREAVTLAETTRPDGVVLDWSLPDIDGFEVTKAIRGFLPRIKILVVSSHRDTYALHRIDQVGVDGFLDKNIDSVRLLGPVLAAIESGKSYFSSTFSVAKSWRVNNQDSFLKKLSDTEHAVLGLIGRGLSDAEIGAQLHISPATAQSHRRNISKKLHISGTPKLMAFALESGVTPFNKFVR